MEDLRELQDLLTAIETLARNREVPGANETLPNLIIKCKQKVGILEIQSASEHNSEMEISALKTAPPREGQPGRPAAEETLTHLGGRIPESMKKEIEALCSEEGCSVSDAMRTGMVLLLRAYEKKRRGVQGNMHAPREA